MTGPSTSADKVQMSMTARVVSALILSPFATAFIAVLTGALAGDRSVFVLGTIGGAIVGLVLVAPFFIWVSAIVRIDAALLWCFGCALLLSSAASLALPTGAWPFLILAIAFIGFLIGMALSFVYAPRYRVYKYAQCPGCGYDLLHLPKSDVCPECGRDNHDLVEKFRNIRPQKTPDDGRR